MERFVPFIFPNPLYLATYREVNLSPTLAGIFATRYWKDKNHHQKYEEVTGGFATV